MSKWFESKNLANYAKTALLQAQKRIDQVLDIKEEDILAKANTTTAPINDELSNIQPSITFKDRQQLIDQSNKQPTTQIDGDNFFSTFLNQLNTTTNSNSNTRSNSPSVNSNIANLDDFNSSKKGIKPKNSTVVAVAKPDETINFDSFVNSKEDSSTNPYHNQQTEQEIETIFNLKSVSSNNLTTEQEPVIKPAKLGRTSSASSNKASQIEKKNWVQNYVDSNGSSSGIISDTNPNLVVSNQQQQQLNDDDSNKTVVNEAIEQYQQIIINSDDNKDEMMASINDSNDQFSLQKTTESCHSSSTTATNNNNESSTTELTIEADKPREDFKMISFNENVDQSVINEAVSPASSIDDDKKTKTSMLDTDYVKIDGGCSSLSGNSQSGHASSAEEQETCASSDIEVISLPSNNGDQLLALQQKAFQLPLIIKNKKNRQIIKPDCNSSESITNNTDNLKQNSQFNANTNVMQIYVKSPPPPLTSIPAESDHQDSILEARESQILKLNKQNVTLQEENDNLQNELEKFKFESIERFKTMQQAHNELNVRCEQFYNENEKFKKINNDLNREFIEMQKVIKEKDEQIEQLKQEGLKLSKQELNQSNIIKKLRSKEKENEETLNILKNDYQKAQKELDELKKILDMKEDAEKANTDTFKKLEKGAVYLEKELVNTKQALEDSQEKVTSLENTLQNTFKELAELHRLNAAKDSRINEATSSIETQYKEEIQTAVEKERLISNKKQETLKWELQSVRADISRLEHQHSLREDMLRKEIGDLQQQLRDTEMRNNELSQNISTATRPLLRQIENLQASHSSQIELLENAERNLIERLKESQANCCELTEKNRHNKEQLIEMSQQIKTYEAQIQTLKSEKSKLNAEYQHVKANLENYENEKYEKDAQNKVIIGSLNQQIEKLIKEKKSLEAQLDMEKLRVETDSKKLQNLMNELAKERELQQQHQKQLMNASTSSIESNSTQPSTPTSNSFNRRVSSNQIDFSSTGRYDLMQSMQSTGAISILESLQSKLKQKDGEINQLQKEIQNLERIRESMGKELVNLSNKLDNMQQQLKEYPSLQENFNKLNTEYNALLQMYGEKSEETEELKLDLQDVKEMYRLQIEDLIKRTNLS